MARALIDRGGIRRHRVEKKIRKKKKRNTTAAGTLSRDTVHASSIGRRLRSFGFGIARRHRSRTAPVVVAVVVVPYELNFFFPPTVIFFLSSVNRVVKRFNPPYPFAPFILFHYARTRSFVKTSSALGGARFKSGETRVSKYGPNRAAIRPKCSGSCPRVGDTRPARLNHRTCAMSIIDNGLIKKSASERQLFL